jgi:hypothetical protein
MNPLFSTHRPGRVIVLRLGFPKYSTILKIENIEDQNLIILTSPRRILIL